MFPLQLSNRPIPVMAPAVNNADRGYFAPGPNSTEAYRAIYEVFRKLSHFFGGAASDAFTKVYTLLKAPLDVVVTPLSVYQKIEFPALKPFADIVKGPIKGFSAVFGLPSSVKTTLQKVNVLAGCVFWSFRGVNCGADGRISAAQEEAVETLPWIVTPYYGWKFNENSVVAKTSEAFGDFAGLVNRSYDSLSFAEKGLGCSSLNIAVPFASVHMGALASGSLARVYTAYSKMVVAQRQQAQTLEEEVQRENNILKNKLKVVEGSCMALFAGATFCGAPFAAVAAPFALAGALKTYAVIRWDMNIGDDA